MFDFVSEKCKRENAPPLTRNSRPAAVDGPAKEASMVNDRATYARSPRPVRSRRRVPVSDSFCLFVEGRACRTCLARLPQ